MFFKRPTYLCDMINRLVNQPFFWNNVLFTGLNIPVAWKVYKSLKKSIQTVQISFNLGWSSLKKSTWKIQVESLLITNDRGHKEGCFLTFLFSLLFNSWYQLILRLFAQFIKTNKIILSTVFKLQLEQWWILRTKLSIKKSKLIWT